MLQIDLWKRICIWGLVALGILLAVPNGVYSRVEAHNDAAKIVADGGDPAQLQSALDGWPSWMPSGLVNLGLDLRGGEHLLAEVKVQDVYQSRIEGMWPSVRDLLRENREEIGTIRLEPSTGPELVVRLNERPEQTQRAAELVRTLATPVASITAAGASDIDVTTRQGAIVVRLSEAEQRATDERTVCLL